MVYLPPALVLCLVLAGIHAALFHLMQGRTVLELPRFLGAATIGFLLGEALARLLGLRGVMLGDVHLLHGSLGAWAGLLATRWWSAVRT